MASIYVILDTYSVDGLEFHMNPQHRFPDASILDSHLQEENFLRQEWEEASLPMADTRPEALFLYEERKSEARAALIAHRKQFAHIARNKREGRSSPFQIFAQWLHVSSFVEVHH